GIASLWIGASRLKNASCATVAATSAPNPAVIPSSCTIRHRRVRRTDSSTVFLSHGEIVLRSIISIDWPACLAASSQRSTIAPHVTTVRASPATVIFAFPNGSMKSSPGYGRRAHGPSRRCLCAKKIVGLLLLNAARRSPTASSAFDGNAICHPIACAQKTSPDTLCHGSPTLANPPGILTTMGAANRFAVLQRIVPQLLSCSVAGSAYFLN